MNIVCSYVTRNRVEVILTNQTDGCLCWNKVHCIEETRRHYIVFDFTLIKLFPLAFLLVN